MAILKVNFDRQQKDVLDNFIPFIADRAYHSRQAAFSIPELQEDIHKEYGINIPGGVLKILAKRCKKRGMFRQEAGVLYPEREVLAEFDLSASRAEVRRKHAALVRQGVLYAKEEFDEDLTEDAFDGGLNAFIKENAAPLLATVVNGSPLVDLGDVQLGSMRYIIGGFVNYLHLKNPEGFEYFSAVVKGALLATSLYFPEDTSFGARLDRLRIYADTTMLLRAVGASGPDLQLLARESIELAIKLGARVYCFQHTLGEIVGVLDACQKAVSSGGRYSYGETTEFMLSAGWGASDVLELKESFEARLEAIGVRVREKPEHDRPLTLDEPRLEEVLQQEIRHRNPAALLRDIDSLTAIYRLRGGRQFRHLDDARAVFVSHNTALARASRRYMRLEDSERETIPLCIADFVLTTLLWLKQPLVAPELPEHVIIADCFAAMRPSDHLWKRYVEKIESLRERERITDDEYVLLRQSIGVRSLVMYQTGEDPDAFTEGTVDRVLAKAHENIAGAAMAEADDERQRKSQALAELERARADADQQKAEKLADAQSSERNLRAVARRLGRMATMSAITLVGVAAAVGAFLATPWPGVSPVTLEGGVAAAAFAAILIAASLSLYGALFGGNLKSISATAEQWASGKIYEWMSAGAAGGDEDFERGGDSPSK
ncbi:hypothetical protein ACIBMZ_02085 [Micromonospora sp. NPDC049900]|uniref:hypothetical protein n=1 Tax=Micromonospora sp. NPDC049900 TaxID=3364275 RepID=UPI0037A72457